VNQPEIDAGDLLLRPWRHSDAAQVARAWADPDILRWGRYGAVVPRLENVGRWVDWNHDQWHFGQRAGFAVCAAGADGSGELVGSIMLRGYGGSAADAGRHGGTGEAGYWVVPGWRGRGTAARALGALSGWAFSPAEAGGLGLRRVELRHSVANPASCRVAAKAGYAHEGTLREMLLWWPLWVGAAIWLAGRRWWVTAATPAVSGSLMVGVTLLYFSGQWAG
jgi:RimJ/RimL family protein N-acetyltransferase